jgi:ADP-ribosylglycohydrolase
MEQTANKILASFYGLAFGDALGSKVNSITVNEIADNYCNNYLALNFDSDEKILFVGDDTQLALYTSLALQEACEAERPIDSFIKFLNLWFLEPKNNRPTCQQNLKAIERLSTGLHWSSATNTSLNSSSGLARNIPVAYWLGNINSQRQQRWQLTQESIVLTHAAPETIVASCLLNETIAYLLNGHKPKGIPAHLYTVSEKMSAYWSTNLGDSLWQLPGYSSPEEYLQKGFSKCLSKIQLATELIDQNKEQYDPCELLGEGWDAEDALAIGLYCFLLNTDNPENSVQRAAFSNGPSDTLAAISGSLAGAYNGTEGWPGTWLSNIEYHDEILELSRRAGRKTKF